MSRSTKRPTVARSPSSGYDNAIAPPAGPAIAQPDGYDPVTQTFIRAIAIHSHPERDSHPSDI